ncbi:MAG: hypothetical protein ACC656_06180 [Candidatus Heimdallarchaeota archaeon]
MYLHNKIYNYTLPMFFVSHSKKRTFRKEDKQISFFTSSEIHETIKSEAKRKNTTIKDYLVRLHLNATDLNSPDNLISEIHSIMKHLIDTQTFLVVPQQQHRNLSSDLSDNRSSSSVNPDTTKSDRIMDGLPLHNDQAPLHTNQLYQYQNKFRSFDNVPYSDELRFSPQLELYLSCITRSNTYQSMRKIIFALYKLKEATHYQINDEIGHTTHNQPRALKRAVEDRIIFVEEPEDPKEPYYYRLNPGCL